MGTILIIVVLVLLFGGAVAITGTGGMVGQDLAALWVWC